MQSKSINWLLVVNELMLNERISELPTDFVMIKKATVKLLKQKFCQQVLRVKKELKNIDSSEFDFTEDTTIFINESLSFYHQNAMEQI